MSETATHPEHVHDKDHVVPSLEISKGDMTMVQDAFARVMREPVVKITASGFIWEVPNEHGEAVIRALMAGLTPDQAQYNRVCFAFIPDQEAEDGMIISAGLNTHQGPLENHRNRAALAANEALGQTDVPIRLGLSE